MPPGTGRRRGGAGGISTTAIVTNPSAVPTFRPALSEARAYPCAMAAHTPARITRGTWGTRRGGAEDGPNGTGTRSAPHGWLAAGAAPLGVAAGAVGACVALGQLSPSDNGTTLCPTKALLGVDCPICGATRAVAAMGRLQLGQALDHNVLLALAVPLVVVVWARWWWQRTGRTVHPLQPPRWAWVALGAAAVAFTVVRNLDVGGLPTYLASEAG